MEYVCEKAFAKINLYLDIESKRADGYHNILTIMQNISLFDEVEVLKTDGEGITVKTGNDLLDENPQKNTAYRASELFFSELDRSFGVEIKIRKKIPMAAGMAGGSADAAAVLRALNILSNRPFSLEKLCEIGKKIGADVPFCIVGGTQIAQGIGEMLTPCNGIKECYIVASCGRQSSVSTPVAYKTLDFKYNDFTDYKTKGDFSRLLNALSVGKPNDAVKYMFNVFEDVICEENTSVNEIKAVMTECGAIFSMMSGSGPSVFGIFDDADKAENAARLLKVNGNFAEVCKPL